MNKSIRWALLVALISFLAVLGLFCLSAVAGGASWGDLGFGLVFFLGVVAGGSFAIGVFVSVRKLLTNPS